MFLDSPKGGDGERGWAKAVGGKERVGEIGSVLPSVLL